MEFKERGSLEFKALQDEMLENSRKIYQIITSTIALSAGLIGYCFSTAHFPIVWSRPFALLSPFLILVPAMILIQSNQLSTVRIAAYLKVLFEECDGRELPGWQTAVQWCREAEGPDRLEPAKRTAAERWGLFKTRVGELTFAIEPLKSGGRHLHAGLRGILCGIAIVSSLGSGLAWWWLIHHDNMRSHPKFGWIISGNVVVLISGWWLFQLAYRDMREGWEKNRFLEWQGHWRQWVLSVEREVATAAAPRLEEQ